MRPIPATRLGDAHGLLRAIDKRGRLRTDEFVTEFSIDELFPAGLENALGRMRHFISYARAAGLVKEDRGVVELTDTGRRYVRAADPEDLFEISAQQAEWLRRQLREKHMTDSIYHGLAIGLSLLASCPPGSRVSTIDFGRSMAYLGRAGWDNENTLEIQGQRYLALLVEMELIDGEHRLTPTGEQLRSELTLPIHMSLIDIAGQLNPGGAAGVVEDAEREWAQAQPPATPSGPELEDDDNGYHEVGPGAWAPSDEEPPRPPIVPRAADAAAMASGDPLAPPPSVAPPGGAVAPGDPLAPSPAPASSGPPAAHPEAPHVAAPAEHAPPAATPEAAPPGAHAPAVVGTPSAAAPAEHAPPAATPEAAPPGAHPPAVGGTPSAAPPAEHAPPAATPEAAPPGAHPPAVAGTPGAAPPAAAAPGVPQVAGGPPAAAPPAAHPPAGVAPAGAPSPVAAAAPSAAPPAAHPPAGVAPAGAPSPAAAAAPSAAPPAAHPPAGVVPPGAPSPVAGVAPPSAAPPAAHAPAAAGPAFVEAVSIRVAAEAAGLRLPMAVYANVAAALAAGKHVLLTGAPGAGKTTLALAIARAAAQAGRAHGATVVPAEHDWAPREVLVEAAMRGRWVIVDELHRAQPDRALGSLSSFLSGIPVVLSTGAEAAPADGWRIVATWGGGPPREWGAVMRRFAVVEVVGPPADELRVVLHQAAAGDAMAARAAERLLVLAELAPLGAGVFLDVARHAVARQAAAPTDEATLVREAYAAYVAPLLGELDEDGQRRVRDVLGGA